MFTLPFGVPARVGVPASLGGEPGLEPGSVLCDAEAVAVALAGTGVCTRCQGRANRAGPARHFVSSGILTLNPGNEAPAVPCLQLRTSPSARTNQAVSSPLERARTVCGRRHTSSCSAPPPGAIAMQHPSRCRPALRRTASTPGLIKFRYSRTYQREMHTSMSRALSRLALAMILAAVRCTHRLSCPSGRQSDTLSRAAESN